MSKTVRFVALVKGDRYAVQGVGQLDIDLQKAAKNILGRPIREGNRVVGVIGSAEVVGNAVWATTQVESEVVARALSRLFRVGEGGLVLASMKVEIPVLFEAHRFSTFGAALPVVGATEESLEAEGKRLIGVGLTFKGRPAGKVVSTEVNGGALYASLEITDPELISRGEDEARALLESANAPMETLMGAEPKIRVRTTRLTCEHATPEVYCCPDCDRAFQDAIRGTRLKRYLAFAGEDHYPDGGMRDFKGDFDTLEEARAAVEAKGPKYFGWGHVWDSETRGVVCRWEIGRGNDGEWTEGDD